MRRKQRRNVLKSVQFPQERKGLPLRTPGWTLTVHPRVESAYTQMYGRMS
ncbi:hypothetical protein [uncultured Bacteroides sp.]|nr:hypothetical protein [uncultured Bacteroides sp.]